MVPLCIFLGLWGGYVQERRMDTGINVYETSYNTAWSWWEKRNHRPGFGNPYAVHSYMKSLGICGIPLWSSGWATALSLAKVKEQDQPGEATRFHKPYSVARGKKNKNRTQKYKIQDKPTTSL